MDSRELDHRGSHGDGRLFRGWSGRSNLATKTGCGCIKYGVHQLQSGETPSQLGDSVFDDLHLFVRGASCNRFRSKAEG